MSNTSQKNWGKSWLVFLVVFLLSCSQSLSFNIPSSSFSLFFSKPGTLLNVQKDSRNFPRRITVGINNYNRKTTRKEGNMIDTIDMDLNRNIVSNNKNNNDSGTFSKFFSSLCYLTSFSAWAWLLFSYSVSDVYASTNLDKGAKLFETNCVSCHVGGGNIIGYARGKTLQKKALEKYKIDTPEAIVSLLQEGKGVMPKYSEWVRKNGDVVPAKLSKDDMNDVAVYVLEQAKLDWK